MYFWAKRVIYQVGVYLPEDAKKLSLLSTYFGGMFQGTPFRRKSVSAEEIAETAFLKSL